MGSHSPTRDWTQALLHWECRCVAIGPPVRSLKLHFFVFNVGNSACPFCAGVSRSVTALLPSAIHRFPPPSLACVSSLIKCLNWCVHPVHASRQSSSWALSKWFWRGLPGLLDLSIPKVIIVLTHTPYVAVWHSVCEACYGSCVCWILTLTSFLWMCISCSLQVSWKHFQAIDYSYFFCILCGSVHFSH